VGERDGVLADALELVIDDVEHLEERHVRIQILGGIIDELARLVGGGLAPDADGDGDVFGSFGNHDGRI
jgi:hypothetical protein